MRQYDYMDLACLLLIYLLFPLGSACHTPCFPFMPCPDLSHNYLTGPAVMPLAARILDLSSNFLSGPLPDEACQPLSFDANCFMLLLGCQDRNYSSSQPVLPPASVLTKGTQRKTSGNFTAAPVTLFVYEEGQALSRCGLELAFHANFTFSLSPRSGRVGFNGFAFVVSATDRVGSGAGVGYGEMDKRNMAVEFDTLQNKEHGDMSSQHVGLNIRGQDRSLAAVRSPFPLCSTKENTAWVDYKPGDPGTIQVFLADSQKKPQQAMLERRLALCEMLQGAPERPAFFFGFVASTTVKPFQQHVILDSTVVTAYGLQLSTNTYMPAWASPFPRYVSADYRSAPGKQDSWVISDFLSWDSVPFLGWPVKDQKDCSACWAFALVASVEAAYGIVTNGEAPQLSVESLFAAMGLTSEADKCITGGSPTEAFKRLLMLPRGGVTETFKYQDPGCYTGKLNHVILVVGYFVLRNDGSQNRIAPPFWILRNPWGVEWGDRGHMRIDIQEGDGVCGINVLPGIYPIVKMDVCGSDLKNPCYVGACINDAKGSYSCICPPNYVASTTIDNFPTCDPGAIALPSFVGGSLLLLIILARHVGVITTPTIYFHLEGDTCWSIRAQLFLTTSNLTALNPGLNCSEHIKAGRSLCIKRNATFAYTVPRCLRYGMLTAQDTCERLLLQVAASEDDPTGDGKENATRWAELYRNNPGLICSSVIPVSASAVGSSTGMQVRGGGEPVGGARDGKDMDGKLVGERNVGRKKAVDKARAPRLRWQAAGGGGSACTAMRGQQSVWRCARAAAAAERDGTKAWQRTATRAAAAARNWGRATHGTAHAITCAAATARNGMGAGQRGTGRVTRGG
ncbi:unnamed protein product [Closterium sp. NIES-65]|nr:unnamed protein product [Closterium sp. NIES-65]